MNVGHTFIRNIFNGYHKASPAVAERILSEVIKLESATPLPIAAVADTRNGWSAKTCWSWQSAIAWLPAILDGRAASNQHRERLNTLSGRKTPHPDIAKAMERVILMMVEEK